MLGQCRMLRTLRLRNLLSYGEETPEIMLDSLNVLIGPNTSGKSNLIEALGIMHAAPIDITAPIREGGGVSEWLWKGCQRTPVAQIDVTMYYPDGVMPLRHRLEFTLVGQRFELVDEAIENERVTSAHENDVYFFYRYQRGRPALNIRVLDAPGEDSRKERRIQRQDLSINQSVLSQRKDPDQYPELTYLGNQYSQFRLYREWNLGRHTPPRVPQKVDLPEDYLLEDASNLGLVLNDLQHRSEWPNLLEHLQRFNDSIELITTKLHGGTVQIYLHERGLKQPIPATRLSDGTLRYICLLTLLCHPSPPPLICIEEPELGIHPDIIPTLAELLIEASRRTQIIVTTHSDTLVSSLTEVPESVIVCEREPSGTSLQRLDCDALREWLDRYTLGDLWRMGEIGGTAK